MMTDEQYEFIQELERVNREHVDAMDGIRRQMDEAAQRMASAASKAENAASSIYLAAHR